MKIGPSFSPNSSAGVAATAARRELELIELAESLACRCRDHFPIGRIWG